MPAIVVRYFHGYGSVIGPAELGVRQLRADSGQRERFVGSQRLSTLFENRA
jgi:hypothetical protein